MKKILLVEDDNEITKLIMLHLNSHLYEVTATSNGEKALAIVFERAFDLIILDLTLPQMDGMEICKRLRGEHINIPIMMLTSRTEESDKVLALELGADDYVTKPFGVLELMARVKALLRRADQQHGVAAELNDREIVCKDLSICKRKRKALQKGNRLDLTPREFDLLLLLASNPGKTFSRQELLTVIWGYSFSGYEHTITAHINRLRIKIENDLHHPQYILTSWGIGYRFSE